MWRTLLFATFIWLSFSSRAQGLVFQIKCDSNNVEIENAVEHAASIWSNYLYSPVPIRVRVTFTSDTSFHFLAITNSYDVKDFPSAPFPKTAYCSTLANALAGKVLVADQEDMVITVNTRYPFYLGLDGHPPSNQYDFVSVLLHEICHGLGFNSHTRIDRKSTFYNGSIHYDTIGFFGDYSTIFSNYYIPSAFDRLLIDEKGNRLFDSTLYPQNSKTLYDQLTSNSVFLTGNYIQQYNHGPAKLYAPTKYKEGTSLSHLDNSYLSTPNNLMVHYFLLAEVRHTPGPIELGVLQDIGWPTASPLSQQPELVAYPNPTHGPLYLSGTPEKSIAQFELFDLHGKLVLSEPYQHIKIDLSQIPSGIYLLKSISDDGSKTIKKIEVISHE